MFITHKILVPFGVATLLATGGAAFLAQNTQPVSGQGVSLSAIDGYSISAIHYTVDPPPPPGPNSVMSVTSVSFDATTTSAGELPAAQGFVKLESSGPGAQWTMCSNPTPVPSPAPPAPPSPPWMVTVSFSCPLTPGVPVNGPNENPIGVLNNLGIEVNQ